MAKQRRASGRRAEGGGEREQATPFRAAPRPNADADPPGWNELGGAHHDRCVPFSRAFLHGFNVPPRAACTIIRVNGDGMEPTMSDGDKILIDFRYTALVHGRVYTVSTTEEGLVTRRAKKVGQQWLLVRDKPGRAAMALPANAKVLGEVRWVAKTLRPDDPPDGGRQPPPRPPKPAQPTPDVTTLSSCPTRPTPPNP